MLKDLELAIQDLGIVERNIREIICKVYDCVFRGHIEIIPLEPCGYQIKFGFPAKEKPVSIAAELPDELFYKYVEDELKFGSWQTRTSYVLNLRYPYIN